MMTEDKARAARRAAARAADRYIAPDGSEPREPKTSKLDKVAKAAKKVERIERAIRIVRAGIPAKQSVARSEFESIVAILTTDYGVLP